MSAKNPNVTTNGSLVSDMTGVRYLCVSCDAVIDDFTDWPDTTTPRCDRCKRQMQRQADTQALRAMLDDDDCQPLQAAMARLILHAITDLTIHLDHAEDGWVTAWIEEEPAAISQGRTRDEAYANVLSALHDLKYSPLGLPKRLPPMEKDGSNRA